MYNAQNLVYHIKQKAKQKNIYIKDMLEACDLNINALSQISDKKGLSSFSLARIADYLDCSVDSLLGRDSNKKGIDIVASKVKDLNMENYNEKTSVLVSNVESWNIKNTQEKNKIGTINENEAELLNVYRSLSDRNKHKLITISYEMQDEATKA